MNKYQAMGADLASIFVKRELLRVCKTHSTSTVHTQIGKSVVVNQLSRLLLVLAPFIVPDNNYVQEF